MDEQVNAVGIFSSLNTVPTVQETVQKEILENQFLCKSSAFLPIWRKPPDREKFSTSEKSALLTVYQ